MNLAPALRPLRQRISTRVSQNTIHRSQQIGYGQFRRESMRPEKAQRLKLKNTIEYLRKASLKRSLNGLDSYEAFREKIPLSDYSDHRDWIERQKKGGLVTCPEISRFQPTSGSTDQIKWIPYSKKTLAEFDAALSPWLYDIGRRHPKTKKGRHYWSISWIPDSFRESGLNLNDTELFPKWKTWLLNQTMAVTERVDLTPSSESSIFASLVYLASRKDLSLVSVWSPTYWLTFLEKMLIWRKDISTTLKRGKWTKFSNELANLECPINFKQGEVVGRLKPGGFEELWPGLGLISCWKSSTSQRFAHEISSYHPEVTVEGKGLWATEGVVTIPVEGQFPVASVSHFYEFIINGTDEVVPLWGLREGQIVQPVLTTSSGLLRYRMNDLLRVNGFYNKTPCLEFLGRIDGTDFVGEKISSASASEILQSLEADFGYSFSCLVGVNGGEKILPKYILLVDRQKAPEIERAGAEKPAMDPGFLEKKLSKHFHYQLARDLGQLGESEVVFTSGLMNKYLKLMVGRGKVLGNIKMEPLIQVEEQELREMI